MPCRSVQGLLCRECQRTPGRILRLEQNVELQELRESNAKLLSEVQTLREVLLEVAPWFNQQEMSDIDANLVARVCDELQMDSELDSAALELCMPESPVLVHEDSIQTDYSLFNEDFDLNQEYELPTEPNQPTTGPASIFPLNLEVTSVSQTDFDDALLAGFLAQWAMSYQVSDKAVIGLLGRSGINFRVKPYVVLQMKRMITREAKKAIKLTEESITIDNRQIPVAYACPEDVVGNMMLKAVIDGKLYHTPPKVKRKHNYSNHQGAKQKKKASSCSGTVVPEACWKLPAPSLDASQSSIRWSSGPLCNDLSPNTPSKAAIPYKCHLLISGDGGQVSRRVNKTLFKYVRTTKRHPVLTHIVLVLDSSIKVPVIHHPMFTVWQSLKRQNQGLYVNL